MTRLSNGSNVGQALTGAERVPAGADFPKPARAVAGWPWTAFAIPVAESCEGRPWPRITIITPSFNQASYLEATIRSVLLQGYPNLEYIVIDGASTDGSDALIRSYSPWLSYWASEPDRGQSHAVNKGFRLATGDLVGWLNSDDLLLPGALFRLAAAHVEHEGAVIAGDVYEFDDGDGSVRLVRQREITVRNLLLPALSGMSWHQPGIYVPRELQRRVGELDESLRYAFDQDWLCRLLQHAHVHYVGVPLAAFRLHGASKTVAESASWWPEQETVLNRYIQTQDVPTDLRAALVRLQRAEFHLSAGQYDRFQGLRHLRAAIRSRPRLLGQPRVWGLFLRCVSPVPLLRILRLGMKRLRSRTASSHTDATAWQP